MDQVLSHEEVDALMSAMSDNQAEQDFVPATAPEVTPFDLTSQDRIVRGRLPGLDQLHDRAARGLARDLSLLMRTSVSVICDPGALMKHGEFMALLTVPAKLALLHLSPLPGNALLSIDPMLADRLIAVLLGGTLDSENGLTSNARREVTPVEERLLRKLFIILTNNLRKAWAAVEPLDVQILRIEFDPAQASVAVATDLVIASSFELRIDDQPAGRLHLAIPFATVEPVRKALGDLGSTAEDHRDPLLRARMAQTVRETPVELVCELGTAYTTLRQFLSLGVDDVLRLNTGVDTPLSCTIEGQPRLYGHPVVHAGNVALEITALVAAVEEK